MLIDGRKKCFADQKLFRRSSDIAVALIGPFRKPGSRNRFSNPGQIVVDSDDTHGSSSQAGR